VLRTAYRFRHTANASVQLHDARRGLQVTVDYGRALKRVGDRLALEPIGDRTRDDLAELIERLAASGPQLPPAA
jgi:hypothetical protein